MYIHICAHVKVLKELGLISQFIHKSHHITFADCQENPYGY